MMQNFTADMKKALPISLSIFFLLASVTHAQQAMTISVIDSSFQPQSMVVQADTSVTWTNNGMMQHTVTADDGSFDSGTLSPGANFSHTFTTPGTYRYYCRFHGGPGGAGMSGTITVTGSSGTMQQQNPMPTMQQYGNSTQYQGPTQYSTQYPQQSYPMQYSQPPQQPPTQQYLPLSNVPYTGYDFGPLGNAAYWFAISIFSLSAAYLLYYYIRGATR